MAPPTLDPPWISSLKRSVNPGKMSSTPTVENGTVHDASSPGPPLANVCMECNSTSSPVWHKKNGGQRLCNGCVYGSKGGNLPVSSPLIPKTTLEEGGPCSQCGAKRSASWTTETGGAIFCSNCSPPDDSSPVKQCAECNVTDTPRWRKAPNGNILCNACGSRYRRKHSRTGPRRGRGRSVRIRSHCYNCNVPSTRWPETLCADCGEQWTKHGIPKNAKTCTYCNMADTGRWLRGPDGPKTLCNACGKRWAKSGTLKYTRKPADFVPRANDDADGDPAEGEEGEGDAVYSGVREPAMATAGSSSSRRPQCSDCQTTKTSKWRTGPNGRRTLCDECGIRWKRSGSRVRVSRPSPRSPSISSPMTTRSRRAVGGSVLAALPAPVRKLEYRSAGSPSPQVEAETVTRMETTTAKVDYASSAASEEHYASSLLAILGKRERKDWDGDDGEGDRASPATEEWDKKTGRKYEAEREMEWEGGKERVGEETMDIISRLEQATELIGKKLGDEDREMDRSELETLNGLVRIGLGKLKDKLRS